MNPNLRISMALGLALASGPALASTASHSGGWGWLPVTLVLAVASHVLLGRSFKAILSAVQPLASGSAEAGGYERTVYGTPSRAMHEIVVLVLASGVVLWAAIGLGAPWLAAVAFALLLGALWLDLSRWERVSASADFIWFQRGLWKKLHQVAIENIRDVSVAEQDIGSFTLRHGTRNRVCRLNLRMSDKRIVALPKTDAHRGLESVEAVANHIRKRQQFVREMVAKRQGSQIPTQAAAVASGSPSQSEQDMLRALKRLRRQAAATPAAPRDSGPSPLPRLDNEVGANDGCPSKR